MNKSNIKFFSLLSLGLSIFLCHAEANAQLFPSLGGQRAGTATLQFLKIGAGARAAAMGGSFVAMSGDASSLYWNPAAAARAESRQIVFSHIDWVVDIKHEFVGLVWPLSGTDALGVSLTSLHMQDMEETTEFAPRGTGNFFTFGDIALGLSYSRRMTDKFSFGLTLKYVEETLAELKTRGALVDIGTLYYTGYRSLRFAVTVSNFGGQLRPSGSFVRRDGTTVDNFQEFAPPITFRFGVAMEIFEQAANTTTLAVQLNHPNDDNENLDFGVEYKWQRFVALRAGYQTSSEEAAFSAGGGLKFKYAGMVANLDYAFSDFGRLGNVNRFEFSLEF